MSIRKVVDLIALLEELAAQINACDEQIAADHFVGDNKKAKTELLSMWYTHKEQLAEIIAAMTWEGMQELDRQLLKEG